MVTASLLTICIAFIGLRILLLLHANALERDQDYTQIASLLAIYNYQNNGRLLPRMDSYAACPDFIKTILELIKSNQVKTIVEAGSGVSSIVISTVLKQHFPDSIHIALEHKSRYQISNSALIEHAKSKVILAPIVNYHINGTNLKWYDIASLKTLDKIDLLIIDGPPESFAENSRYPALDVITSQLNLLPSIIVVDDANRDQDLQNTQRWAEQYGYSHDFIDLKKGCVILKRK